MPDKDSTGLQHSRKFLNHFDVVRRISKESEGCEKIENGIESTCPVRRQLSHVAARVAKIRSCAALARELQQMLGVVEPVDFVPRFSKQMRMTSLSAGYIEDSRLCRKLEYIEKARDFLTIAFQFEDWLVLEKVVRIEISLPPLGFLLQKKTGSR